MARFVRWYGSGPLHLLVLIASFALTGYAMVRLFAVRPLEVAIWFVGAAILHDLILLPLYSLADLSALSVLRHRATAGPTVPWINYLRVPAFLSSLLLLVWFPLIFRLAVPTPVTPGCPTTSTSADGWRSPACSLPPPRWPSRSGFAASGGPPAPTRNAHRSTPTVPRDDRGEPTRTPGPLRTGPADRRRAGVPTADGRTVDLVAGAPLVRTTHQGRRNPAGALRGPFWTSAADRAGCAVHSCTRASSPSVSTLPRGRSPAPSLSVGRHCAGRCLPPSW